jgi:hypothetical protein
MLKVAATIIITYVYQHMYINCIKFFDMLMVCVNDYKHSAWNEIKSAAVGCGSVIQLSAMLSLIMV